MCLSCNRFLNFVLVLCLLTPAVVNFWRGAWYMLDLFLFPSDKVLSASVAITTSFGTIFTLMLVEDHLKKFLNGVKAKKALYLVLIYLLAFLTVASWRGLWMLLDHYTTTSLTSACVSHAIGFLIVLTLKTPCSIIAVPGYCISERHIDPSIIILNVKHRLKSKTACYSRIWNSFVSVFVIGAALISYWRGTWIILSNIRQPCGSKLKYLTITLGLGYIVSIMCYCLSEYLLSFEMRLLYSLWSRALEIAVDKIFVYLLGFGVVASWQGIWHIMDIYLLSDQPIVSALVGHFVATVVIYLSQGSLNLLASPATCRIPEERMLDGLHLGNYLKIGSES